ncbi:Nif3-like dinuclear metal center hexameric protein [Pseudomonas oryzihabitans]|uniref:Nif3-like dinuclear metal center hexameric protein n=1 Tax=Pseudomonas oryzihabitans TaxID=47885 RepID=UPI0011211B20|nr:Nif3-like dinuclear metal center hexameric protein [Pseudomonas psychrotolerans]QDD89256.1 Nif3-like dinuclear metal center hexameric protein [Pseudomonas psychrotolerans]
MRRSSMSLDELVMTADRYLESARIQDYCPNGLQIQGRAQVRLLVSGVTASQQLLDAAVAAGADAILVHHGYFWKNEDPRLVGMKQRRIKTLLSHDISLLAYHLPLDVHAEVGNNIQLGRRLGLQDIAPLPGDAKSLIWQGELAQPLSAQAFGLQVAERLQRAPLVVDGGRPIRRLAWCTGGAQGYIDQAIAAGVDAYLTGEVSEQTVHSARENGVSFFAAGHHATERYGVQALGDYLAAQLGIEHRFIDCDNPA